MLPGCSIYGMRYNGESNQKVAVKRPVSTVGP